MTMDKAKRDELRAMTADKIAKDDGSGKAIYRLATVTALLDTCDELESQSADANALLIAIKSMQFNTDEKRWHGNIDLKGAFAQYLCMMIYTHFVEAQGVNYVEQEVFHEPTADKFACVIQRKAGKTVAEVNTELRVENERLKAILLSEGYSPKVWEGE